MTWLIVVGVVLMICFGYVLLFGAPYLPTLRRQIEASMELAALQPGQTMIELGCGDGRVVLVAAKKGINVVGYELNPLLFALCWVRTLRYRSRVKVVWGNFWKAEWPQADVIYAFLLPKYMNRLNKKITQYKYRPVKLVSFAFKVPNKKFSLQRLGVFLYHYK